jgi:cytochrome c oxidase assembly protein subunit 15/protoheme IX farnesyltransferase
VARLARFAWFVVGFNVVVILLGALVRATGSGAGCGSSWPTCQGELVPEMGGATSIEYVHRLFSGVALVIVIALAILVWRRVPRGEPARVGAALSAVAIVIEALIGAMIVLADWVAHDASLARVFAVPLHLVNTLFLLASLTLTAFWLAGGRRLDLRAEPAVTRWVMAGGIALVVLAASGAVTALADTLYTREGIVGESHFLTDLRIIHPVLAVLASAIAWWVSGRKGGPQSRPARAIPLLVGAMLITGALNVVLGVPIWMQLVHLALADGLWIAYVLTAAGALQVGIEVSEPV